MIATQRPAPADFPVFYHRYVDAVDASNIREALQRASELIHATLDGVPEQQGEHRYAEGKWTIKDVLQHVIDGERIFAYRALRFARNDATELPGFEENDYVPEARTHRRTLKELLAEHDIVRSASLVLFDGFDDLALERSGIANGQPISVNALGWVIAGHAMHHARVLQERYLK